MNWTDEMAKYYNNQSVVVKNLGNSAPGEYKGIVKGIYGDISVLVEMIDPIPGQGPWSVFVFPFGCVIPA